MLEQASLIDSGFFHFGELGKGLVLMSPAKSNQIRIAILLFYCNLSVADDSRRKLCKEQRCKNL